MSVTQYSVVYSYGSGFASVVGFSSPPDNWELTIPSTITVGNIIYDVTSIGGGAFQFCSQLTSITIPNSVTSIGFNGFWLCTSLTNIIIPNSVTSIEGQAFYNCTSLTSITISNRLTSINSNVFSSCSLLMSISIPNSVTSIGGGAFSYCSSLTSISIPDSVTSIDSGALQSCTALSNIIIPNSVMNISEALFYGCSSLTDIMIPSSVTSIDNQAFAYCSSLMSITIPSTVTNLGYGVFIGCSSLVSITIPSSVTSIGFFSFSNCSSLSTVIFNGELLPSIVSQSFQDIASLPSAYMSETAYNNPNNQITIGLLNSNTPPFLVVGIPSTFDYSYLDTSLSYTLIDFNSVYVNENNQGVSGDVIIPSTVTVNGLAINVVSISASAFNSSGLISIVIPNSVTSIGTNAFANNVNLASMVLSENTQFIPEGMCDGCINLVNVTTANVLMRGIDPTNFSANITSIGNDAFRNTNLDSIDLTNCSLLTSIGNSSFESCSLLTKVVIPSEVTSIGSSAFANSTSLTKVYFIGLVLPAIQSNTFGNVGMSPIAYMSPAAYADPANEGTIDSLIAQGFTIEPIPNPCFLEGSKILTPNGYKAIEELRKGDLVKTLNHGYMRIDKIGTKEIYHSCSEERLTDELFRCSTNEYPELTEDLILTGAHSILVEKYKNKEEKEKVNEIIGSTYLIDKKCRLPACIDSRTSVYEIAGMHRIYHLALENNDKHKSYGIYANGLLVESCSKYYLEEKSEMKIIE